ncbi:hypothetical protein NPIL_614921 [Nephila pilipes]|uniref:Uncharacterized protein n=1 Tax=Nephila pilipes TaxID=299642 RepID=A0A8X6PAW7_NEPPI|nr:hypothetical protein NPIL_614921 [Nephila pilipes]
MESDEAWWACCCRRKMRMRSTYFLGQRFQGIHPYNMGPHSEPGSVNKETEKAQGSSSGTSQLLSQGSRADGD